MPLQIRRGTRSQRLSITPLVGELVYDTTDNLVYVGNGTTAGGIAIDQDSSPDFPLGDLSDINLEDVAEGDILKYDGNNWVNTSTILVDGDNYNINIVDNNDIILVDSATGVITAPGGIIGNIITNSISADNNATVSIENNLSVEGQIIVGNLITNSISADDSSTVSIENNLSVEGQLVVENSLTVPLINVTSLVADTLGSNITSEYQITLRQQDTTTTSLIVDKTSNSNNFPSNITLRRTRGTLESKIAVSNNDRLGALNFTGFDGQNNIVSSAIVSDISAEVAPGIVPSSLKFFTTRPTGGFFESLEIDELGVLNLRRNANGAVLVFNQAHNLPFTNGINFSRSRNTVADPTPVNANDVLGNIAFLGRSIADLSVFPNTVASIRSNVDGLVAHPIVPGRIEFHCQNSSGVLGPRMIIKNNGRLQVNHIESLSPGSLAVYGDLIGSVFADNSSRIIDSTAGGRITTPSVTLSEFLQLPVYADDTNRLAGIPTPAKGMVILMEVGTAPAATNQLQFFNGTNWTNL